MRVERLGYFDDVNIETPPVPGTPDQVDIEVTVDREERPATCSPASATRARKASCFNASVSQQNIFGSGNALALSINTSRSTARISLHVHRAVLDGRRRLADDRALPARTLDPTGLVDRAVRVDDARRARSASASRSPRPTRSTSASASSTRTSTLFADSPPVYVDFVNEFGYVDEQRTSLSAGWSRDTRDDILYPTQRPPAERRCSRSGCRSATSRTTRSSTCTQWFWPVYGDFVLMLRGDLGYGDGYGGKPLPFFKAFYAGGVGSVRGYETGSLGPRDIFGNALGGKRKIVGNAEVFYPILKGDKAVRGSVFVDAGPDLGERLRSRSSRSFRYSAGVGRRVELADRPAQVQLRASRSNAKSGDRIQRFQFQVGHGVLDDSCTRHDRRRIA